MALDLLGTAGLATEQHSYAAIRVGDASALRVALEAPGDTWAAGTMPGAGLLYEAEATGDYSYRGTDPASYDQVFDQESGVDDLTPRRQALRPVEGEDRAGRQAITRFEAVADLKGLETTATARLRPDLYTGT